MDFLQRCMEVVMRRTLLVLGALGSLAVAGGQARARPPAPGPAAAVQAAIPVQWDGDRWGGWRRHEEERHEEWRAREEERRREEWHHRRWLCEHRGICE